MISFPNVMQDCGSMICETIRMACYDLNIIIIYNNGNRSGKQGIILREYMNIFLLTNA